MIFFLTTFFKVINQVTSKWFLCAIQSPLLLFTSAPDSFT